MNTRIEEYVATFNSLSDMNPPDVNTMAVLRDAVREMDPHYSLGWLGAVLDPSISLDSLFVKMVQETMWSMEGYPEPKAWPLFLAVSVLRMSIADPTPVFAAKYELVKAMWELPPYETAHIRPCEAYNALRKEAGLIPYNHIQMRSLAEHCRKNAQDVEPPWESWGLGPTLVLQGLYDDSPAFEMATVRQSLGDTWTVMKPTLEETLESDMGTFQTRTPVRWTAVQLTRNGKYFCTVNDIEGGSMIHLTQGNRLHALNVESYRSDGVKRSIGFGGADYDDLRPLHLDRTIVIYVDDHHISIIQGARLNRTGELLIGLRKCGMTIMYDPMN